MRIVSIGCVNAPPIRSTRYALTRRTGLLEFTEKEIAKLRAGRGGVWRLPPVIGGSRRDPLPRFTILTEAQKEQLRRYFREWGGLLLPALVPGAHVCVAGHPMLQPLVQVAMAEAGFEIRPALLRLYFSFRGGDRPKNAEKEFSGVCVTPKGRLRTVDAFPQAGFRANRCRKPPALEDRWFAPAGGRTPAARCHPQRADAQP